MSLLLTSKMDRMEHKLGQLFSWTRSDLLRDLYLSGMSPREIMFGALAPRLSREMAWLRVGVSGLVLSGYFALLFMIVGIGFVWAMFQILILSPIFALFVLRIDVLLFRLRMLSTRAFIMRHFASPSRRVNYSIAMMAKGIGVWLMVTALLFAAVMLLVPQFGVPLFVTFVGLGGLSVFLMMFRRFERGQDQAVERLGRHYEIILEGLSAEGTFRLDDGEKI